MKICIAGKNNIAINLVDELIKKGYKKNIFIIYNKYDDGKDYWQRSFYKYSIENNLNIIKIEEAYEIEKLIFISLEYDNIVDISKFRKETELYNVHFSKLPKYKGMYTSAHPILNGEKDTGVTLHKIDNGIDTGDIIDQLSFEIENKDTARSLYFKYIEFGTKLILKNLDDILCQNIKYYSQEKINSTYFSKKSIDYKNLNIDLNQTAYFIQLQIRAFTFREYQLVKIKNNNIISSKITNIKSLNKPGTIIFDDEYFLIVSTIDYNIILYKDKIDELFKACELGELNIIKKICKVKEHINIQNEKGWTPLIVATYFGNIEIVKYLISIGADIKIRNFNGTNLLMYSKENYKKTNNRELYDLFLTLGISKNQKDYYNKSLKDYLEIENISL